ncbi:MAG: histidine phosphatase family protein [Comamonadaceae bacterium]|nr:MAG: histidine phosphatase family protein [Comamonadaceae bacterium]
MQVTRLLAVRHGETLWNADGRLQGHLDIPLNDQGLWQAERTGAALADEPIGAIYSSDLQRAWQTAQAIAQAQPQPVVVQADERLRERAFGEFQGRLFTEIEAERPEDARRWRQRDPDFAPAGGGESLVQFRERVITAATELAARHPGTLVLLVAHGGVMDLLYRAATSQELQAPRTWELRNAAINRLLWTPQGFSLVGWNDSAHLQQSQVLDESTT